MRAEVKVLIIVVLAAVVAYFISQPTVACEKPLKLTHAGNITEVTVAVGSRLYTLNISGNLTNDKICVVFYRGVPSKVVQNERVYDVVSWSVKTTLEKMPEVRP